jgi:hypothetical protein
LKRVRAIREEKKGGRCKAASSQYHNVAFFNFQFLPRLTPVFLRISDFRVDEPSFVAAPPLAMLAFLVVLMVLTKLFFSIAMIFITPI